MKKIIYPGKFNNKHGRKVFVEIVFDDGNLSIHGVIGARKDGDAYACGQIVNELDYVIPSQDWTKENIEKLRDIWKRWHLNDFRAGSPKQEEFVRKMIAEKKSISYESVRDALKEVDLYEDKDYLVDEKPYKYGHSWLKEEVPSEIIDWLFNLPTSKEEPAWI